MKLEEKKELVEYWKERFDSAAVVLLTDYSGLNANEINILRQTCRETGVLFQVVKNTLAKRALEDGPYAFLAESFKGPVAVALSEEDQVAPAKVMVKAAEEHREFELITGGLEGSVLDIAAIRQLSKMPGRDELRGRLLGLFNNVPGGFVRLLNAVPGGFVNVLDARKRKLEEEAA